MNTSSEDNKFFTEDEYMLLKCALLREREALSRIEGDIMYDTNVDMHLSDTLNALEDKIKKLQRGE